MQELMPFIVAGLATGAIYGLAGTGLVVSYKTSGIFNFAYPALAAVGAYSFYFLHYDDLYLNVQLSWPAAAIISVFVIGPLMGLGMELIARGLAQVSSSLQIVATVGIALSAIGGLGLFYQDQGAVPFTTFLSQDLFQIGDTFVSYSQLILFLFALLSVVVLYIFFRVARLGVAMRAVVDNPDLLTLSGESAPAVRRWAWIISSTFASASGVLLAGEVVTTLSALSFFSLIVASFGAAAIGAFRSLPLTFVGGLGIGVLGALASKYEVDISWLGGVAPALPFIVLFVVLIVTDPAKLRDTRVARPRQLARSYQAPWKVKVVFGVIAVAFLALAPQWWPNDTSLWASTLIYTILLLSLGLLVKESGQVSLCQTGLAAIGGVAFAHSTADWGLPWGLALLFAGLVATVIGFVIAVPAIRVSGVFLALATFGFGLMLQQFFYPLDIMFTTSYDGLPGVPRPSFAQTDEGMYYLVLGFAVITALAMLAIAFGRLGRLLRGLGDSALALNTMGDSVNATRVLVFCISSFFAAIAGALYASYFTQIGSGSPPFQPFLALQLFAIVILVGVGTPWYGLLGAISIGLVPTWFDRWFGFQDFALYLPLLFGVGAVTVAFQADRRPILAKPLQRFFERFRSEKGVAVAERYERPRSAGSGLAVEHLTVRFGGIVAVNDLGLEAPIGRITGLIGPNGAGKTTTFNVCSGIIRPNSGRVSFQDRDIGRFRTAQRARLGIGRTFQHAELWDTLTVHDNIQLGREAALAGVMPFTQLAAKPGEKAVLEAAVRDAAAISGITDLLDRRVGDLSTGQRRLVELARVLAGTFDLLLLDEPSSGLDRTETERFGEVLQRVVRERGTGILLVEHDMTLVMEICEYIYVMDFGEKIFEGSPPEVMDSDVVRAAYLGSEELEGLTDADTPAGVGPAPTAGSSTAGSPAT